MSKNCEKAVFKIKGRPTLFIPLKEVNVAAASASVDGLFDGAGQSNETLQKQKKVSLKTPATLVVFFNYNSRNRIRACAQWKESFSKHLWFAFVVVFLAEMGRIPCCGRPESSSSNI